MGSDGSRFGRGDRNHHGNSVAAEFSAAHVRDGHYVIGQFTGKFRNSHGNCDAERHERGSAGDFIAAA